MLLLAAPLCVAPLSAPVKRACVKGVQPTACRSAPCRARRACTRASAAAASAGAVPAQPGPLPGAWSLATTPEERKRLLLAAVKPPIYSVALVPVLVGFATSYFDTGAILPSTLLAYVACACLVIAWLNLSNDAWDAETSVDVAKKESVVRLTGSVQAVHTLAGGCLALGAGGLATLCLLTGAGAAVALRLAAALACGVLYQAPPFRWSYKGLGEPLCFLAFGPLATSAFALAARAAAGQPLTVSPAALAASLLVGATTTAILFCSHFHQEDTDRAAGKRSPIVRLGVQRAAGVLSGGVVATYAGIVAACLTRALPLPVGCAALCCAPLAGAMMRFVGENYGRPEVVFQAKFFATRWHAACGLLLTLAFAAARAML